MSFVDPDAEFENDPSLKADYDRILTDLRENPLSITVEKSEFLYHPSDYIDSRAGVVFIGDLAYLAGLFVEFWAQTTIKPIVFTNVEPITQSTILTKIVQYQEFLQKSEIDEYKVKMEASPLNMTLTDEQVDEKVNKVLESGDKSRLPLNSKDLSTNNFDKIPFNTTNTDDATIIAEYIKAIAENDQDNKVKLIVFVNGKKAENKIVNFQHPTIPTVAPDLDMDANTINDWDNDKIDEFSTFIRNLPDVLSIFM